jgi:hypothetical protein
MNFSDETLMAYVDGEADAEARAAIETALVRDPQLLQRIEQQRMLKSQLTAAFSAVLSEPIPQQLTERARTAPAGAPVLGADRNWLAAAGRRTQRWSWPEWGALAASLCIGILFTRAWESSPVAPLTTVAGRVLAQGDLATDLATLSGGTTNPDSNITVGMSYLARSGHYCRTFTLPASAPLAGVACHEGAQWRVQALIQTTAPSQPAQYRMAETAVPPMLLGLIESDIAGDPLDAQAEAAARARSWVP